MTLLFIILVSTAASITLALSSHASNQLSSPPSSSDHWNHNFISTDQPSLTCASDEDCLELNSHIRISSKKFGYICVSNTCKFTVVAGEVCRKSSDCAQYQWVQRQLEKNISGTTITGIPNVNISDYLNKLCDPGFCNIQSFCDSQSDPLFNSTSSSSLSFHEFARGEACCGGGNDIINSLNSSLSASYSDSSSQPVSTCSVLGNILSTCSLDATCQPLENNDTQYCAYVNLNNSTRWIGIIITLLGAIFNSVGLNLQKLALRTRDEKKVVERPKKSFFARFGFRGTEHDDTNAALDESAVTDDKMVDYSNDSTQPHTFSPLIDEGNTNADILASGQAQLQRKLDFASLVQNRVSIFLNLFVFQNI